MKYPLSHYWYFLIRHGRTSLLIATIAIIVIILASWQLAYGLFSNTSNKPTPQTTDTKLQESDATLNQSLVSGGETADTKEKKKEKKSDQPTEEAKDKEQTPAQNNSNKTSQALAEMVITIAVVVAQQPLVLMYQVLVQSSPYLA